MISELVQQRPTDSQLRCMTGAQLAHAIMHALERSRNHPRPTERARWRHTYEAAKRIQVEMSERATRRRIAGRVRGF